MVASGISAGGQKTWAELLRGTTLSGVPLRGGDDAASSLQTFVFTEVIRRPSFIWSRSHSASVIALEAHRPGFFAAVDFDGFDVRGRVRRRGGATGAKIDRRSDFGVPLETVDEERRLAINRRDWPTASLRDHRPVCTSGTSTGSAG